MRVRERERERETKRELKKEKKLESQTDGQTDRQTDRQTDIMSTARHSPLRMLPEANHWLWVMHGISTKKNRRESEGTER